MPKKRGRPKRRIGGMGIKTGAKALERKMAAKARALREDPSPLLPEGCERTFAPVRRALERVQQAADDEDKLRRLARKGDPLARAYAGTLLLLHSDISPTFGVIRLPHREVSIAYWGKTSREKTVGVQYYDDPVLRLYCVKDIARKKRIWIYSTDEGMVCTGRTPDPPGGLVGMA
ncbi:MAG: hypothetical protein J7L61_03515, partial [Thermoplasmata archaeon]|nr:hypothetical protein [Thermoplasmata archaeon]